MTRVNIPPVEVVNPVKAEVEATNEVVKKVKTDDVKKINPEPETKKVIKTNEKKSVAN